MVSGSDESPINPLPPVVVALALALFGVEIVLAAAGEGYIGGRAGIGWRIEAQRAFAFAPAYLGYILETGAVPWDAAKRFVTYAFLHHGFSHLLMVEVFLLALGKLVAETLSGWAVIVTFVVASVAGALVYGLVVGGGGLLIGGYPAVYGLIGTYTFLLWTRAARTGQGQWRAFRLIGFLLMIQLIFGAIAGLNADWVAEIAGFAVGFAIAPVVAPGGFTRLRARLRGD